jgi:hypothetical protein
MQRIGRTDVAIVSYQGQYVSRCLPSSVASSISGSA